MLFFTEARALECLLNEGSAKLIAPLDIKKRPQCFSKSTLGEVVDVLDVAGSFVVFDEVSCGFIYGVL